MPRADIFLVTRGYAASRSEAQAAIAAGRVFVNGVMVAKPAQSVADDARVEYEKAHPYVSRGGLKLAAALDHFSLSPGGRVCLDVGASTGGFTEVLLARGAAKVFAVDVGHGQLHEKLRGDARVIAMEGVNARALVLPEAPQVVVADVSFISLKLALPSALERAAPGAFAVLLVKPQFEAGRAALKDGIVRDAGVRQHVLEDITHWLGALPGWRVLGAMQSPITGGDGNIEYLIAAAKDA